VKQQVKSAVVHFVVITKYFYKPSLCTDYTSISACKNYFSLAMVLRKTMLEIGKYYGNGKRESD
jgi:hypothetical protein